jgi:peptide-N4-(N-acetyl-beta-glucosaminyl)asparagine amidase
LFASRSYQASNVFLFRVVEGSNDGGSSWHLLDKQTSQIFEDRFQRRAFKVTSVGLLFNTYR